MGRQSPQIPVFCFFDKDGYRFADKPPGILPKQPVPHRDGFNAPLPCNFFGQMALHGSRHGAGPSRIGKHVEPPEPQFAHQSEGFLESFFAFTRETDQEVG